MSDSRPIALETLRVVKVHILAEHLCPCGKTCLRMTVAEVLPDGRIGAAQRSPGEVECNDCAAERREEMERQMKITRQQRAWARKHVAANPPKPGGGKGSA